MAQASILSPLIRGSEAGAEGKKDDGLGGGVVVEGVEEDLEVATEVRLPLLDDLGQVRDARLLVLVELARAPRCRVIPYCRGRGLLRLRRLEPPPLLLAHVRRLDRPHQVRVRLLQLPRQPVRVCREDGARLHQLRVDLETITTTTTTIMLTNTNVGFGDNG